MSKKISGSITDTQIKRLLKSPPAKTTEIPDGSYPGLSLRIGARGRPAWFLRVRPGQGQKQVRKRLGHYPEITIAKAHQSAEEALARLKAGDAPFPDAAAEIRSVATVSELAERFFTDYLQARGRRSAAEVERELRFDLLPALGKKPVRAVTRRDIRDRLEAAYERARTRARHRVLKRAEDAERTAAEIERRAPDLATARAAVADAAAQAAAGAGMISNRLLAHTRKLLNWAVEQDYIDANPAIGLKPLHEEVSRSRILSDDEIAAVWAACGELGTMGAVTRALLLTGQRLAEVTGMRWSELDLEAAEWRLPEARTKNGRDHIVPLSPAALKLIQDRPRIDGSDLVFTTTGRTPVSGFSKFKKTLDGKVKLGTPWRLHDLRRTVASGMAALRVAPHVIESTLNHSSGKISGVAAIYNRFQYLDERRHALTVWAAHVEQVTHQQAEKQEMAAAQ